MVRYGKEQRDGAVGLYIRYERCAVDVIHELGYPGRGMLPVLAGSKEAHVTETSGEKPPTAGEGAGAELVREAFENGRRRCGYKRVHLELESMGVRVSARRVMRLMTPHGPAPPFKSAKRYGSYKGELAKAPKNPVDRDFHAEAPNRLWVTDLTEFSIPAGKAYLSPVIDRHDGMPVAWSSACVRPPSLSSSPRSRVLRSSRLARPSPRLTL